MTFGAVGCTVKLESDGFAPHPAKQRQEFQHLEATVNSAKEGLVNI